MRAGVGQRVAAGFFQRGEPRAPAVAAEIIGDLRPGLHHLADGAFMQELAHGLHNGPEAAIVGHRQRHGVRPAHLHARLRLRHVCAHRLLAQNELARSRGQRHMLRVPVVGRRNVDRVDLRVGHERFGLGVPAPGAVPPRKILRLGQVAPHHGHQLRAGRAVERRPAFIFGHVAAADDAPAKG